MIGNLPSLVGGIVQSSHSVAAASQEISASTEEIAGSSTAQASAANSITELFEELSLAINSAAQSAKEAANLSNETVKTAIEGDKVVQDSLIGMQEVNQKMSRLEDDFQKIGEIIEVIDDIAIKTIFLLWTQRLKRHAQEIRAEGLLS